MFEKIGGSASASNDASTSSASSAASASKVKSPLSSSLYPDLSTLSVLKYSPSRKSPLRNSISMEDASSSASLSSSRPSSSLSSSSSFHDRTKDESIKVLPPIRISPQRQQSSKNRIFKQSPRRIKINKTRNQVEYVTAQELELVPHNDNDSTTDLKKPITAKPPPSFELENVTKTPSLKVPVITSRLYHSESKIPTSSSYTSSSKMLFSSTRVSDELPSPTRRDKFHKSKVNSNNVKPENHRNNARSCLKLPSLRTNIFEEGNRTNSSFTKKKVKFDLANKENLLKIENNEPNIPMDDNGDNNTNTMKNEVKKSSDLLRKEEETAFLRKVEIPEIVAKDDDLYKIKEKLAQQENDISEVKNLLLKIVKNQEFIMNKLKD